VSVEAGRPSGGWLSERGSRPRLRTAWSRPPAIRLTAEPGHRACSPRSFIQRGPQPEPAGTGTMARPTDKHYRASLGPVPIRCPRSGNSPRAGRRPAPDPAVTRSRKPGRRAITMLAAFPPGILGELTTETLRIRIRIWSTTTASAGRGGTDFTVGSPAWRDDRDGRTCSHCSRPRTIAGVRRESVASRRGDGT
jgi:hypothetical protein